MNARERLLLTIIAVLAVLGAGLGARRLYVDRSEKLADDLRFEKNRLEEARDKLAAAEAGEREWKTIGKQTIAADAMVAKGRFREELIRLTRNSGFGVPPQVDLIGAVPQGRNGLTTVVYQLKVEGTTNQVVDLLFALYRQPYLVRCRSLDLKPVVDKGRSPAADSAADRRLVLSLSVETPILPGDRRVPRIDAIDSLAGPAGLVDRLSGRSVGEYRVIDDDLFGPPIQVGPIAGGRGGRGGSGGVEDEGKKTGGGTHERPPADAHLLLARVLSSPRVQQVVLEDPTNRSVADRRVEVGDEIYRGRLIFIHRAGAVSESAENGKRLFHAVGAVLDRGEELSAGRHPDVFNALMELERRLAVGSREPLGRPLWIDSDPSQSRPFVTADGDGGV